MDKSEMVQELVNMEMQLDISMEDVSKINEPRIRSIMKNLAQNIKTINMILKDYFSQSE